MMLKRGAPYFLALCALILAGCDLQPVQETKLGEVSSPGAANKAILYKRDCGATCSITYVVYIGEKVEDGEVLIVDHSERPQLRWQSQRELVIAVPCGRVFKFSNVAGHNSDIFIRLENDRLACA